MNTIHFNQKIAAKSLEYQSKTFDLLKWLADEDETLEGYAACLDIDPLAAVDEADLIDQILAKEEEIFFK